LQSRRASFVEASANVVVGLVVAFLAQQLIFPAFGLVTTLRQDLGIAAAFSAVSVLRGFVIRRLFERVGMPRRGRGQVAASSARSETP
jgi:hypothetical protein